MGMIDSIKLVIREWDALQQIVRDNILRVRVEVNIHPLVVIASAATEIQ
jgi:hypothetical protein